MTWLIFALFCSLSSACFAEANRFFQMEGFRLNFWRIIAMTSFLLPAGLVLDWPAPSIFYVAAIFSGTIIAFSPAVRMTLSAHKMGRVTTLYMPVEAFTGFGLWLLIDAVLRNELLSEPWRGPAILIALTIVTVSLFMMRQNDASWRTFLVVAPLGVLHGLSGVFAKFAMPVTEGIDHVLVFMLVANFWAILISACFLGMRHDFGNKHSPLCPKGMVRAAAVYGALGAAGQFAFYTAIKYAGSPGYVTAVAMLAPVWIMLLNKARGMKDDANPVAGLMMVLAAVLLVIVTSL